jgi:hypothetical protein
MRYLALLALAAIPAGAAASSSTAPLQALTEADVGADALKNAACYAHDGPAVLLVATKKNAVVNADGDLRLLQRSGGGGFPSGGARYRGTEFEVVISPTPGEDGDVSESGRRNQPAQVRIVQRGKAHSFDARWSCAAPSGT